MKLASQTGREHAREIECQTFERAVTILDVRDLRPGLRGTGEYTRRER